MSTQSQTNPTKSWHCYLIDGLTAIVKTDYEKPRQEDNGIKVFNEKFHVWREHVDGLKRIQLTQDMREYMEYQKKSDWDELIEDKDFVFQTFATTA